GVAALVASHFPTYTPDQIAARVRATSDPIDSLLYYKYQKLFGFGRVNAYRAVHDTGVKAVVIDSFYVSNDNNNDGVLEPGETGAIRVRLKNLLSPTSQLTATLVDSISGGTPDNIQTGVDPYVTITNPNDYIGALPTFGTALTPSNTFIVKVAANTPQNYLLHFRVDFADGTYHDYRYFTLFINPTFVTMDENDISCTFNSRGNEAFNDFPTNSQGIGFTYKNGSNLLFEGALILATDAVHVVNVARDDPSSGQDTDFTMVQRAVLNTDASAGTQEATAAWNDANADPTRKLGVSVSMHNYEYTTPGNTNFVIVTYAVQNTSGQTLNNLDCGIYLDWDIGPNGDSNYVSYDDPYRLGWISKVNSTTYPVCGSVLLSSQTPSFYAIDNNPNSSNPPFTVNSGFTFAEKYTCLSSGIGRHNSSIGDVGNTIGGGPVTLAPGQKDTFAFALLAGSTLNSLEQGVIAARQLWQAIATNQIAHVNIFLPGTNLYATFDSVLINTVKNNTGGATTATLSLAGPNSADFAIISPTTLNLTAGQTENVDIRFTPTDTGLESAFLLVNYQSYTDTIDLFGTGLPIGLSYTPAQLSYDSVAINQASRKSVTIVSSRTDTVYANLSISGPDSSYFSIGVPSPITIPPGGVTFPVDFQPLQSNVSNAFLIIKPTVGLPDTILLTGTGYIAGGFTITAYPSPLVFDTTTFGDSSNKSFIIYNSGADSIQVYFQIVGTDSLSFTVPGLTSPITVAHGQTAIPVKFTPTHIEWNYAAFQFNTQGGSPISEPLQGFSASQKLAVHEPGIPQTAGLVRNYPNPFSVQTTISFAGLEGVHSIVVYNMIGGEVADLSSQLTWGNLSQQVVFDGSQLPGGVYFY
ncbi:MAG TPA: choice-of-anchor D domain-containing protein, partial [Candidatus Kapabacteria bacterium]|nr:choice-of-anchor D domain-containing protein [Candidatus Kapabacteria bacterium]